MLEQLSIFLENKPGTLEVAVRLLAEAKINIRTLAMADTADFGVLRLLVNDVEKAAKVLKDNGFAVSRTPVLAVEVPDRAGGLAQVLTPLREAGINIEYLYAFVERSGENAVIIFRFSDYSVAKEVLKAQGISVLEGERLYKL